MKYADVLSSAIEVNIVLPDKDSIYQHIKSGNLYKVLGVAVDSTNNHHDSIMIIYRRLEDSEDAVFCRDANEFMEKFELFPTYYVPSSY